MKRLVLVMLGFLLVAIAFWIATPSVTANGNADVCPGTHLTAPEGATSVVVTATPGYYITQTCIKAGSGQSVDNADPTIVAIYSIDDKIVEVTLTSPTGENGAIKEISHYSFEETPIPVEPTETPTTEPPTPTPTETTETPTPTPTETTETPTEEPSETATPTQKPSKTSDPTESAQPAPKPSDPAEPELAATGLNSSGLLALMLAMLAIVSGIVMKRASQR